MAIALHNVTESAGTDTSAEVSVPASTPNGAVMVVAISSGSGTTNASITNNASWTLVRTLGPANNIGSIITKIYTRTASSEPASYTFTVGHASGGWNAFCAAYTGVDADSPILIDDGATGTSGTSMATPSVSNTDDQAWRLESFSLATTSTAGTWSINNGDTERHEISSAATVDVYSAWYDSNGVVASGSYSATGTATVGGVARTGWIGFLTPEPDPPSGSLYVYQHAVRRSHYY